MSKGRSFKKFIKEHREIHKMAKIIAIIYGIVYYISTGYLSFERIKVYDQTFAKNFLETIVDMASPFLWKPVAFFEIPPMIRLQISPINIGIMLLLTYLVYKNLLLFITSVRYPRVCQMTREKGLVFALIPTLFAGITCVAPIAAVFILNLLGIRSNVFIEMLQWAIPISLLLLIYGVHQGYQKLHLHY